VRHTINQEIGELDKIVWDFQMMEYHGNHVIFLENMFVMNRESRRHKFKIIPEKSYSRINSREYLIKEEPDVPIEVSSEAVYALRKSVTFQRWPKR
jgi:hypothetical protein